MAWNNAVVTNKGIELLKKVLDGGVLNLDYAAGGTGISTTTELMEQTELAEQNQQFPIISSTNVEKGKKVKIQIANIGLDTGYILNQIGIWAHVDNGESVLFAILQDDDGMAIPAETEGIDFLISFYAVISFSNEAEFSVTVDSSAFVSMSTFEERLQSKADLNENGHVREDQLPEMNYILTSEKSASGGVATLDNNSKIPEIQLPKGSTTQYGAVKAKEGNGLVIVDGIISFQLTEVSTPVQEGTLTYNGSEQSPTWGGYDSSKMTISGTTSATDAGTYTVTFNLLSAYKWEDGSTGSKSVTWTIDRIKIVTTPSQSGTLTYTGSSQSPTWSNYNTTQLTISGTTSSTNAGTFSATFTPTSNYMWSGGSTTSKSVSWVIDRAAGTLTRVSGLNTLVGIKGDTKLWTFTKGSTGALTASSSNTSVATVSVSGSVVTIKLVATGSITITVTAIGDTNYNAVSTSYSISVSVATTTLQNNTWSVISQASALGIARSLWSIGDIKSVVLSTNVVYHVQIVHFSASRTTFQFGITGSTNYAPAYRGEAYYMNPTADNTTGWANSYMRKTVMPLMLSYLPSDLQSELKSVEVYNNGGYVYDKLFLMSEYEVFGVINKSVNNNYGEVYFNYYKNGNSRVRYVDSTNVSQTWYLRSVALEDKTKFCGVGGHTDNGEIKTYVANIKRYVSFAFCV